MTKKSTFFRPLFAFGAALFTVPLSAGEPMVVTGEPQPVYREQVNFADLDLRQSKGRQTLVRRVEQASTNVCIQTEGRMNMNRVLGGPENTCPNRTYSAARPQIMAAIRRANSGQPQSATALVVTGPAQVR